MEDQSKINWIRLAREAQGETAEIKMSHLIYLIIGDETTNELINIYLEEGPYSETARVFMSTFESTHLCQHIIERMDHSIEDIVPLALLLKNWNPPHLPLHTVIQWLTDSRKKFQWAAATIMSAWVTSSTISCSQQQWQQWAALPGEKKIQAYMLKKWGELKNE